jgi:hypothetical protein
MVIFLSACVERILQLFTNFYLQRKFSIFLRNNHDCKVVDPFKARKRYTVTESLDLIVSVIERNPMRIFLNLNVNGGVCILTRQMVILDLFQPTTRRLYLFFLVVI